MLATIGAGVYYGCNNPSSLGSELLPGKDKFQVFRTDTLHFGVSLERDDSLVTSAQGIYLLGAMDDPDFGTSYAGIFAQVLMPLNNINFGSDAVLDSAALILDVDGYYGSLANPYSFVVYRLAEDMAPFTVYREDRQFAYDPVEVGRVRGLKLPVEDTLISIPLHKSFAQWLFNQSASGNLSDNSTFLAMMKGLYIAPDTSNGYGKGMLILNLRQNTSGIRLYYHRSVKDSLTFTFFMNAVSGINNYFKNNFTGTRIPQWLNGSATYDTLPLEGMAGLRVRLQMPDLTPLGNIIINKAELVLTKLDGTADSIYDPPDKILPRTVIDSLTGFAAISDEALGVSIVGYELGGQKVQEVDGGNVYTRYKINLSKHMHQTLTGVLDTSDIVLKIEPSTQTPARVLIGGPNHPDPRVRMKLNLIYTKMP